LFLKENHPNLHPVLIDITREDSVQEAGSFIASDLTKSGLNGLFGLVNNAGVLNVKPLEFENKDSLTHIFNVNVLGHILVTNQFLPLLRNRRGRIVNTISIAGRMGSPFLGSYTATKHAMEAVTDIYRQELARFGVFVSGVEPGIIKTDMTISSGTTLRRHTSESSSELQGLYRRAIKEAKLFTKLSQYTPFKAPDVANRMMHALTSATPKYRYVVGYDAHILAVLHMICPRFIQDLLVNSGLT